MVFTQAALNQFFTAADQMAIPELTRQQLALEGITGVEDLSEFDKDGIKQLANNLQRTGRRIPDPANANATVPALPFVFGTKSQQRLTAACEVARYYETVGRTMTPINMRWMGAIKAFIPHWKALTDKKKNDDVPDVPKITKALVVIKWTEAFGDFLNRVLGRRFIPLAYVIRPESVVPAAAPDLATGQPYGAIFGSVEEELVQRGSHDHALFREDNALVYFYLEEATRSTSYAASIKPFQRAKNGRGAWLAMVAQYAGEDKWRAEWTLQDDLLHNREWKGQSNYSLEKFIAMHRNAFVVMTQCETHLPGWQLANEQTRVFYLLGGIKCNDAPLQAAMAMVRNDTGPDGKLNNFEATASFLLPHDPVALKRTTGGGNGRRSYGTISSVSSVDLKDGTGKSGVEFRYHKTAEYNELNDDQKSELHDYRESLKAAGGNGRLPKRAGKGGKSGPRKGSPSKGKFKKDKKVTFDRAVAAAVAKQKKESTPDAEMTDASASAVKALTALMTSQLTTKANASAAVALPPPPPDTSNMIQSITSRGNRAHFGAGA